MKQLDHYSEASGAFSTVGVDWAVQQRVSYDMA